MHGHAPLNPPMDSAGLIERKVVAGLVTQQDEDFLHRILHQWRGHGRQRSLLLTEGLRRVGQKLGPHLGGGPLIIHHPGGNRAARHAVILRGADALHHHHPALGLDGAHTQRAIAARPRKHDPDGPLMLILRERAEEKVNRHAASARSHRFQQLQRAVQKGHVAIGRNDVGAVGLHLHSVLHFEHLHAGVAADQFGENALMVRRQMLHQNEGHTGIATGGEAGKERFESRQPAGRRPDAYDGETFHRNRPGLGCFFLTSFSDHGQRIVGFGT